MMAQHHPPFKRGQKWRLKTSPRVVATIHQTLMSRACKWVEAWGTTDRRHPEVAYPFPESDRRGRSVLVNIDEWERVLNAGEAS